MRHFIVLALTLLAASAHAQAPQFDATTMNKQLRANGIDPAFVGWAQIDPLCTAYLNYKDDPTEYNQCRYDKAVLQTSYNADRETCDIESLAVTPDSIRKQPAVTIGTYKPGANNDTLTTITTPTISRAELKTQRAATYNRCMTDKGWKSPRNWRLGYAQ